VRFRRPANLADYEHDVRFLLVAFNGERGKRGVR